MKRILVGVCSFRHDDRFWNSFFNFMKECNGHYDIASMIIKDTFLPDAQNKIAECAINSNYDYILLLDDDHWGHTKEMLDCLVEANVTVATMKTYSRHYPYMVAAWDRVGNNTMLPIENGDGYRGCDLCGFPMTLIEINKLHELEKPYFRPLEAEGRTWNSDVDFFERLALKGIRPVVCFQHCLNHDKITQDNVFEFRNKERVENNNIAWFSVLQELVAKGA